jgi:hypothetical protein
VTHILHTVLAVKWSDCCSTATISTLQSSVLRHTSEVAQNFGARVPYLLHWLGYVLDGSGFKSCHQGQDIFLFSKMSRVAVGLNQPHIRWIPRFFPRVKVARAWIWPLNSIYCWGKERAELYVCFPLCAFMAWTGKSSFPLTPNF